ncbi:MAG TPA: hypothetical protein VKR31_03970 [Rhizomicrobium sp.]|nr:hypothetical protein [Rhizomicrobium sp.]
MICHEQKEQPTFCIWTKHGRNPSFFHTDYGKVSAEAERLAQKHRGRKFLILRVEEKVYCTPEHDPMEQPVSRDFTGTPEILPAEGLTSAVPHHYRGHYLCSGSCGPRWQCACGGTFDGFDGYARHIVDIMPVPNADPPIAADHEHKPPYDQRYGCTDKTCPCEQ